MKFTSSNSYIYIKLILENIYIYSKNETQQEPIKQPKFVKHHRAPP